MIAFLGDSAAYGTGAGAVETIETHISRVFLVGDRVYKLKRAVRYPYVDFSTVAKRRVACEAELTLNRRAAPELYLGVRPVMRGADGRIGWSGGDIVDWVVMMSRFPEASRLDVIAHNGGLTPPLLNRLAAHIADFHAGAEISTGYGGRAAIGEIIRENDSCLRAGIDAGFAEADIAELRRRADSALSRVGPLLDRRRAAGKVRRGHGDLHLRNICVIDGMPRLFDCLEFSESLASIDVLYDLAFLLMDLAHEGYRPAANAVFNRYLDLTDDDDGVAAVPLFISLRAAIRAHVCALAPASDDGRAAARAYLRTALAALHPAPARLVAIGGLSGTGKSSVAAALAPDLGAVPGARVLRSDVIRKRLLGVAPETRLPETAYTHEVTARVYAALRDKAAAALHAGHSAIIDAVALRPNERHAFAAVAAGAGAAFAGLWLEAPRAVLLSRVAGRRGDASDADSAVVELQLTAEPGIVDWHRIDACGSFAGTLAKARTALGL